jgi:hypothetical protein
MFVSIPEGLQFCDQRLGYGTVVDVAGRFETTSDSDTRHGTRLPLRACGQVGWSFLIRFDLDDYDNDDEDHQSLATVVRTGRRVGDIHYPPLMYRYLQYYTLDEQAERAPPQ